jgi:hypothetical protein
MSVPRSERWVLGDAAKDAIYLSLGLKGRANLNDNASGRDARAITKDGDLSEGKDRDLAQRLDEVDQWKWQEVLSLSSVKSCDFYRYLCTATNYATVTL